MPVFSRTYVPHDHCELQETYFEYIDRVYADLNLKSAMEITFQVTERCNLKCTYCYQGHKTSKVMSLDTAKKIVDLVLSDTNYVDSRNRVACVLDFFGGEPLLEIGLIRDTYEYFLRKCYELNHPWLTRHRVSICSNGVRYFDDEVQRFLDDYRPTVSFAITIDGPKELHDACRVFHDGSGSHAIVEKSVKHAVENGRIIGTKITVSPNNLKYLSTMVKYLYEDLGLHELAANCTFEGPWSIEDAGNLYYQLCSIADYCYENDTYSKLCVTFFREASFVATDYSLDDSNWCGGNGKMLAFDPDGKAYPCVRYMPTSLGTDAPPVVIGDVDNGLINRPCEKCFLEEMVSMTATSQSPDECLTCPVSHGCAWCSGYNYQKFARFNKRDITLCDIHKATALANSYYWNKFYEKHGVNNVHECYVEPEDAIQIIGNDEYSKLLGIISDQRKRVKEMIGDGLRIMRRE